MCVCVCVCVYTYIYTGCNRRNGPNLGRVFLRSNYTDKNQNTYSQSSMVTEKLAREKCLLLSAYAKYIAQELETLPKEMAMYCQRVINGAIFEAQMGSLNRTSRVVTEPICSIPPQQVTDQPTTSHFSAAESAGQFFSHFQEKYSTYLRLSVTNAVYSYTIYRIIRTLKNNY